MSPIKVMKYNPVYDTMISGDTKGIIEYWSPTTLQFPEDEYVLLSFLIQNPFYTFHFGIVVCFSISCSPL